MIRRNARVLVGLGVVLLVLATYRLTPLWPGPGLPPGATRLHIATEAPHLLPTTACEAAALVPASLETRGDDLVLIGPGLDQPIAVVWPSGWAAWRLDGRAELVTRDGALVGREGDTLDGFGGGTDVDGVFHVCVFGS